MNNPVRRRLFTDDLTDEARVDNFANALQEATAMERIEKMKKWNFDFKNEVRYIWYYLLYFIYTLPFTCNFIL